MAHPLITVTAPTGRIGSQLLRHLVGTVPVRVIARDPSKLQTNHGIDGVEVVTGSHADPDVLARALPGTDTVFWLVPPDPTCADIVESYREFTEPFSRAVRDADVRRIVAVSTLGRGWQLPAGHLSAALVMDEMIRETGVPCRTLRMPYFMDNALEQAPMISQQHQFAVLNDPDRTLLTVATGDVARAAAAQLLDDTWEESGDVPVVGPDDLSPNQMAAALSEVAEATVGVQHIAADQYVDQMVGYGMSPGFARGLVEMAAAQDAGIYDQDAAGADRTQTSWAQWCRETLKPAL